MKQLIFEYFINKKIVIVGGGNFCKELLKFFFEADPASDFLQISGVADINNKAVGFQYAKEKNIYTTTDYKQFYNIPDLDIIFELTRDSNLNEIIRNTIPDKIKLIDHLEARVLWDTFKIERQRINTIKNLQKSTGCSKEIEDLFNQFAEYVSEIVRKRTSRFYEIEKELVDGGRTLTQIIQGSTIPTFVINKEHIITHWNTACEKLTGFSATELVGTNNQWMPFRSGERPTMADIIISDFGINDLVRYYGAKWKKSDLIKNAYAAEDFFPNLGENGKWLFFTAAPINAIDGTIVGAIETLWDRTEEKLAEQERDQRNQELSTLCSIYSALSTSHDWNDRLHKTFKEIIDYLSADEICVFLLDVKEKFKLSYSYGIEENKTQATNKPDNQKIINQVAQKKELTIIENLSKENLINDDFTGSSNFKSIIYLPLMAKEKEVIGVIKIGSKTVQNYSSEVKNVLELIGNRIGAAIENYELHEQYRKSEEKYRSLFDNDPNPIFIIDYSTHKIIDVNKRARDCYGYTNYEFTGMHFADIGDAEDTELTDDLKQISQNQSVLFSKKRHYRKGRKPFFVNVNICHAKYGENDVLIASTTDITESVEKEAQLIQASKMTTLGTMAAGIAHEINQPLNVIQVCVDYFLKMIKKGTAIAKDDLKTMSNDISSNVQRAAEIIKHMRDFARQSDVVSHKINLNDPIQDVFDLLGHQLTVHQIELKINLDPQLPDILAEHNRLEQVFINLVTNAVDAIDEKGEILKGQSFQRMIEVKTFLDFDYVVAIVSDTGNGMPREVIGKVFEPFFTTKDVGKGTGLGVSISYGIIKDYHGTISIQSKVGKGTSFELRFPVCS